MQYRLRTLLILLAVGPPVVAYAAWILWQGWQAEVAARHLEFREVRVVPPILGKATND